MYPEQTFNNWADLLAYINTQWVTNGAGDITGVIGNNVVNGLLTFITQSPFNNKTARVISSGGVVSLSNPITILNNNTPTSVSWGDNVYNEWVIVNTINADINLASSLYYLTPQGNQISYIPAYQALRISKAANGMWVQTNNFSAEGGSGNTVFGEIDATVGADSPIIIPTNATTYTINSANIATKSVKVYIDGSRIFPNTTDQISVDIIYTPNFVTITFFNYSIDNPTENLGLQYGMKVIIDYAVIGGGGSVDTFDNTFDNTFS